MRSLIESLVTDPSILSALRTAVVVTVGSTGVLLLTGTIRLGKRAICGPTAPTKTPGKRPRHKDVKPGDVLRFIKNSNRACVDDPKSTGKNRLAVAGDQVTLVSVMDRSYQYRVLNTTNFVSLDDVVYA